MNFRRSFLKKLTGAGLGAFSFSLFRKTRAEVPEKKLFLHHVFFWLNNPEDPGERMRFEGALKELGSIDSIRFLHIGQPADTDRDVIDTTYHYSFLVGFRDKAGHDIYQEHPIHERFRNEFSSMWTKVLVYDSINL